MQGGIFIMVFPPLNGDYLVAVVFFLLFQLGKSGVLYGASVDKYHRKKAIGQLIYRGIYFMITPLVFRCFTKELVLR